MKTKIFDTSSEAGLKQAEKYQAKLYDICDRVIVKPIGLYRVMIYGKVK